jgi:thioredoxin reductase (NADPH)
MAEHDLDAVAFPTLDAAQIERLARCCSGATLKRYHDGEKLFKAGERGFKFFVIRSGKVEIVDDLGERPRTIAVHGPGEFTGEVAQLTGTPTVVSAIARGDCKVYEMPADALRDLLNRCPGVGDIILQAFIARRHLLREPGNFTGLRVIGSRYSRDTLRVRDFLSRNQVPYSWLDLEADPQVDQLLKQFGVTENDTPVVAWGRKLVLRNPSNRELAEALGLRQALDQTLYDLVIVGAGPAGLAAAVYGASEGLNTLVPERTAPGGQAGHSMRIENYPGFPIGLSGSELAERAFVQANKFGAHIPIGTTATGLTFENAYPLVHLDSGETVRTKCLLIATGAEYRKLDVENCERFEGCGVYYAATLNEAQLCRGAEVIVVGGGNSAGQAAVFLAAITRNVYLLIRGDNLFTHMSSYLARRIEETPNIEVLCNTTVRRMTGDNCLRSVEVVNHKTGEVRTIAAPALFSFIGAVPRTDWLPAEIEKDPKGFIRTGPTLAQSGHRTAGRPPFLLETSRPGVFAAGDVRSGSIKRVASAVGEGAMAIQLVHEYLKQM